MPKYVNDFMDILKVYLNEIGRILSCIIVMVSLKSCIYHKKNMLSCSCSLCCCAYMIAIGNIESSNFSTYYNHNKP